ncbi:MAG: adenylyltransferase/cytidyltransferase family protein [Clostridia bacterium]|nr:adenylyltransferase/cytidyltransferase family protein [Clostridia bacterium]
MSSKAYELGIMVGRFQTLHTGHQYMIDKAVEICDTVGIFIGSSQESGTEKNPFTYETRRDLLKDIYGDRICVNPLPDIGVGNNSLWGDYVLKNIVDRFGRTPDLIVSGKESRRTGWFESEDGLCVSELYVPKTIEISATQMREFFINNDYESWKKYTDSRIWDRYETLRQAVLLSQNNRDTASI